MSNWLEKVVPLNVKLSTSETYSYTNKHYILPYLGNEQLRDINPGIIDKFMRELTLQGLAKNTLSGIHSLLSHALDYAVYPAQIIASNPAKYIKVSKKAPTNVVKRTIITQERFNELLTKYPFGSSMYIPLLLLYHTGMRISEVCGLTWNNIDLDNKIICLNLQVVYIEDKGDCFAT